MKVIIAGSRHIAGLTAYAQVSRVMRELNWPVTEVVSGAARGVDSAGENWARHKGIPVKRMPARWDQGGRAAGYYRNAEMADYADALVAIWDGESRGTAHMIRCMNGIMKPVIVHRFVGDGLDL